MGKISKDDLFLTKGYRPMRQEKFWDLRRLLTEFSDSISDVMPFSMTMTDFLAFLDT